MAFLLFKKSFLYSLERCIFRAFAGRIFFVLLKTAIVKKTAMIEYVKGLLVEKTPSYLVIECNGLAYLLHISLATYSAMGQEGTPVKVFAHQVVREDAQLLFGFATREEREVFRRLLSVSGVGAGMARAVLSSMEVPQIVAAIENGDAGAFKRVKGVGLKTSQRIILELRGKVDFSALDPNAAAAGKTGGVRAEALDALEVLGFVRKNCETVVDALLSADPAARVEEVVKRALKNL